MNTLHKLSDDPFVFGAAYQLYYEAFGESVKSFQLFWASVALNHSYYVLDQNKELIALCLNTKKTYIHDQEKLQVLSISGVCVKASCQNQGWSKKILSHVLAKEKGHFDYIFLQAYNYNYYKHLDFHDALFKHQCLLTETCNYSNEILSFKKDDYLDYNSLYPIFLSQKRFNAPVWELNYQDFKRYIAYALQSDNGVLYKYKSAYCILYDNEVIALYAFVNLADMLFLLKHLNQSAVRINLSDFELNFFTPHLKFEKEKKTLMLQTNKLVSANLQFLVWDYFI